MGGITSLVVWREAAALAAWIDEIAKTMNGGGNAADQMVRAADSITANIAEGYGRGNTKDALRFWTFAHSSADELESHLRLAGLKQQLPEAVVERGIDHTRRTGYLAHRYSLSVRRRLE